MLSRFSHAWLSVTLWTAPHQAPLCMGFSRQEYWTGLSFPSPGDLPNQGSNLGLQHCRRILYRLRHHTFQTQALVRGLLMVTKSRCPRWVKLKDRFVLLTNLPQASSQMSPSKSSRTKKSQELKIKRDRGYGMSSQEKRPLTQLLRSLLPHSPTSHGRRVSGHR